MLDVRMAVRSFRHSPGFTATAIVTLAVGIGATTAIFSMVEAILLRPLPYHAPERLVRVWESKPSDGQARFDVAAANFADWQARSHSFAGLALFDTGSSRTVLATPAGSLQVHDSSVTPNFFALLGVQPRIGRVFITAGDAAADALREVVIGDELWKGAFAADQRIVGTTVRIEGRAAFIVVGVMPPGFTFPGETQLWFAATRQSLSGANRGARFSQAIGRLKDDVTLESARADLSAIARELAQEHPPTNAGWTVAIIPLRDALVENARLVLLTLLAAVGFVLLAACANVANLMLARGVARQRELAIRAALGASRGQITRQLLTECLLVSAAACVAGWLLATQSLPVLWFAASDIIDVPQATNMNGIAFGFCVLVSGIAALLIGLIVSFAVTRRDFHTAVQWDGERIAGTGGHSWLQHLFVTAQAAVTLVLVVGAVLLARTVVQLRGVDLGFSPEHVISIDVRVPFFDIATPDRWYRLARRATALLDRLRDVPGVEAAATTSDPPLSGRGPTTTVTIRSGPRSSDPSGDVQEHAMVRYHRVSSGYFATLAMPLTSGRDFDDSDASNESQLIDPRAVPREGAAIVNEAMARRFWPEGGAVGHYLSTSFDRRTTSRRRIVGVVRDHRSSTLRERPGPEVYVPYLEDPSFAFTLLVRTMLPAAAISETLRREMRHLDPETSAGDVRTLDAVVTIALGSSRLASFVVGVFAGSALLLSALGIYGVLAVTVVRRTREIGVRIALGASGRDMRRLFMRRAMLAVGAGVAFGVVGALAVTRLIASMLFGIGAADPLAFAAAILVLMVVAFVASYVPVRRALRMEPVAALRS